LINGVLLFLTGIFILYADFARKFGSICLFKIFFHGYCPFCGGTRALSALLKLDFASLLTCNAFVGLLAIAGGIYDLLCLYRLLRHDERPFALPRYTGRIILILGLIFFLGRNLLLWVWGIDPIGDFIIHSSSL